MPPKLACIASRLFVTVTNDSSTGETGHRILRDDWNGLYSMGNLQSGIHESPGPLKDPAQLIMAIGYRITSFLLNRSYSSLAETW